MPAICTDAPTRVHRKRRRIYSIWAGMMNRCYDRRTNGFDNYGGRGIAVCDRWHSFASFIEDVGEPPSPTHQIDRLDNDDDYRPGNWKWSTPLEQANSRRNNRVIEFSGRAMTLAQWAREIGVTPHAIACRIKRHGVEVGLSAPKCDARTRIAPSAKVKEKKSSRFRGVCRHSCGRFEAFVRVGGKKKYLGLFASEGAAALAYDTAARELFGEHCRLNFPPKITT